MEVIRDVSAAAELLSAGRLVVFPTETVYGVGARADNDNAVQAIFTAKGRSSDNPLIVHVATVEMAERYAVLGPLEKALLTHFSPGPLTLVAPLREGTVSESVTARGDTVAIRIPDSDIALELIRTVDCGLAAPSANRSSRPSPTSAEYALREMNGRVDAVLDGGRCQVGIESTVAMIRDTQARVLRPGVISEPELNEFLATVDVGRGVLKSGDKGAHDHTTSTDGVVRSPGTSFRHYSPNIPVRPLTGDQVRPEALKRELELRQTPGKSPDQDTPSVAGTFKVLLVRVLEKPSVTRRAIENQKHSDVLSPEIEQLIYERGGAVRALSSFRDLEKEFYSILLDWERSVDEIWVEIPDTEHGYGGLRDRILRAAGMNP